MAIDKINKNDEIFDSYLENAKIVKVDELAVLIKVIHIKKWLILSKNDLYTKLSTLSTMKFKIFLI